MNQRGKTSGEFTGRHMLVIMLAFFGVIIAVNLTMASFANSSWSGLVVKNSYVASQEFNEKAAAGRAQAALGWSATMAFAKGEFIYSLVDKDGNLEVWIRCREHAQYFGMAQALRIMWVFFIDLYCTKKS